MPAKLVLRYACAVALGLVAATAEAKEVTLPYKGLTLNANLEFAAGKNLGDGVILITHGGLAHRSMELIVALQDMLKERGFNTLAINLSLGLDNRRGMYDCAVMHRHSQADAVDEIGVWADWLKQQGAARVVMFGHSLGGLQTALYMTERDNPAVTAVVLLAPATRDNFSAENYQQRFGTPLAPLLEKAQKLVAEGKGGTTLEQVGLLNCSGTTVTANAFASYYTPDPRLDSPSLIPKFRKPTLVVIAVEDQVVVGLEKRVAPLADGKRVRMKIVDSADHFFRDLYAEDAADAVKAFLDDIGS